MNILRNWFRKSPSRRTSFRPMLESLDERAMPSWIGAPPTAINFAASPGLNTNLGGFGPTGYTTPPNATFIGNEVDYRTFVAPRSGSYHFTAGANGSNVDTVAGLFSAGGTRLAYNDDSNGTLNSSFDAPLSAGQTYVFGVTTYGGNTSSVNTGGYRATITLPNLYATAFTSDWRTYADVSLSGTTLRIHLHGESTSDFSYDTHRVEVRLMNRFGQPIHDGPWSLQMNTSGGARLGPPSVADRSWTVSAAGYDVGQVAYIEVRVSHNW